MNRAFSILFVVLFALSLVGPANSTVAPFPNYPVPLAKTKGDLDRVIREAIRRDRGTEQRALQRNKDYLPKSWIKMARVRGGIAAPVAPSMCPKGTAYEDIDKCNLANPNAVFINTTAVEDYALDADGDPQTIYHPAPYNMVGVDFATGQLNTVKEDPRTKSVIGVATITGGTTLNISNIGNLGTPQGGMRMWDRPSGGTQHYAAGQAPSIVSCTAGTGGFLYQCVLSRTVTNRSAFSMFASFWYGCVNQIAGVDWGSYYNSTPTTPTDYDAIRCDFRSSADTATAQLQQLEFGPAFGHNATRLTAISHDSTLSSGTVEIDDFNIEIDQYTETTPMLETGLSSANIRLKLTNGDCNGGNSADPLDGPFTFPLEGSCFNWDSPGSVTHGRNQVLIQNVYVHDWSGRPMSTQAGNTDTVFENIYSTRINLNCGDNVPPSNGCHGTLIGHGTTIRASSGSIKIFNVTAVYPYGQRNGVISGVLSIQGGISSANQIDFEAGAIAVLANTGAVLGHSTAGIVLRIARVGEVTSFKAQHVYINSVGVYGCVNLSGDLQANAATTGAMVANAGTGTSTMTWSGFSGSPTLYFPGSALYPGPGSSAPSFKATLADNLNGTSTLTHTGGSVPTLNAGMQVIALHMADMMNNPTIVLSGSGPWIVSNGSGSGETRAEQTFNVGYVIKPFGTINPATGLPSTATGGSNIANWNGTTVNGGELTFTAKSPSNWSTIAPRIGNATTIDADVHDLYMMNVAGSGGHITLDGADLGNSVCPNTQAP